MPISKIDYRNLVIFYKIVYKDLSVKDVYVGSTTDFIRRKSTHKCKATSNSLSNIVGIQSCIPQFDRMVVVGKIGI